jgi:ABC-type multidrug transport system fused ATPase/permease subunit
MSKKEKYNNNINNDVEIPLQDLKIPIIEEENDLSLEKDIQRKILKKEKTEVNISFCSRLFFLWTLIVMKLSNKGKLKKEIISESPIFTSEKEKNKFHEDFIFIKQLWEGKKNRGGFNKWSFSPMIFTVLRFNLTGLLFLVFLLFIVQSCKMIMLFFKRRIIQLFSMREQNQIENYSDTKFRYMLIQNVSCFLIIELLRFIINHQLKYRQRKLTRKTTSHISLLIYEKFMKQKLLPSNMKEGDLINYLQTDTESMASFFLQISKILIFPYQFITYFIILYKIFGKAFFVGVSTFSLLIVFSIIVEVLYIKNQYRYLTQKDRRINFTSQVIKNIKELKLLQWEDAFKDVVNEKRAQELIFMKKRLNFSVVLIVIHWIMPLLLCLSTLGAYVKINDKLLDIADLMTALEIIDNLRGPIIYLPDRIRELINAYVSMNRVAAYLKINTEKKSNITKKKDNEYSINIVNAKIGINKEKILMSINELKLKKNETAIIIGETGSGKSCLIKSLIDRLIILNKKEFNIDGKISYTSQTPFIINSTVKDNILFYSKYNEERYKKVIKYCELERDIQSLPAGDLTEIGTNGANLSGGQKSRINLARCVYKDADIYLFDDPISSVDSIVYNKILSQLIKKFLKNKTIIFASNDVKYMNYFNKVIFVEKEQMKFIGTNEEIKKQDFFKSFKNNLSNQNQNQNKKKQEEDSEEFGISNKSLEDNETNIIKNDLIKSEELIIRNKISRESIIDEVVQIQNEMIKLKGKLMVEEEINAGKIDSKIYKIIIEYSGGYFQVFLVFIFAIIWQFTMIQGNIYLTHWSNITDINDLDQNLYHFMIYTLFGIACIFSLFLKEFLISKMNYNISDNFHNEMLQNIIDAPINLYHDITPFGQIMNKFTIDLDKCVLFFRHFSSTLKCLCTLIGAIVVCVSSNRYVLFFLPIIFFFGYKVSIYYAPAGRDILRIESIDRSPLISFYSESIQGIDTIKSLSYHHVDDKFFDKFAEKLLGHLSIFLYKFGTRTFFELSLDLLSVLFVFFLFIYCIFYHQQFNAITVSLLLKYSFNISDEILTMLTHGTELENSFVRIERCESATHLPKENFDGDIIVENRNEFEGDIKLDHICIKYRPQLDNALEDLSVSSKKMPWKIK